MVAPRSRLSAAAALLLAAPLCSCLDVNAVAPDTPIASLVASAKVNLAQGNANEALEYFELAIKRDPENYLTVFQRGATYLSLGRNGLANDDFNKVLAIKPGFEGALVQRAKIKSRNADWDGARKDYLEAGKDDSPEYQELLVAEGAATLAKNAEADKDWEACVGHAGTAIMIAGSDLELRNLRARCRFERGEVLEGVSDLQHVLHISPGLTEPYLRMSAMLFYSLADTEKGLAQVSQCLRSDQDNKACKVLRKQEKRIDKDLKKIAQLREKRQYNSAVKLIVGDGEDAGLIEDVKEDIKLAKASGMIHENSPNELYNNLVESACEFYNEMNNKKRAGPFCEETLLLNPDSLHANIHKARRQMDEEDFEGAIQTLNHAKEQHPGASQIQNLLQKASIALKRSKTKDYYKVLGVANDADDRTIKKAYRSLTKIWHPDKAASNKLSKDEAEKKMASINEAYEVLSDPEKRAQFDRGDDPNNPEHQGNPFHGSPFGGPGGQQFFFQSGPGGGGARFQFQGGFPGGFPFGGM